MFRRRIRNHGFDLWQRFGVDTDSIARELRGTVSRCAGGERKRFFLLCGAQIQQRDSEASSDAGSHPGQGGRHIISIVAEASTATGLTRAQILEHSLEWIVEIISAYHRNHADEVLRLAQAISTIFDSNDWMEMQAKLIDQINS